MWPTVVPKDLQKLIDKYKGKSFVLEIVKIDFSLTYVIARNDNIKTYIEYYVNGKYSIYNYKNDLYHGKSRFANPNSSDYADGNFRNGKKEGEFAQWHPNGMIYIRWNYKNGNKDGVSKTWYRNGNLEEESNWKDGYRDGVTKSYREDGSLYDERIYENVKLR